LHLFRHTAPKLLVESTFRLRHFCLFDEKSDGVFAQSELCGIALKNGEEDFREVFFPSLQKGL
jgi:hypothetical protein